MEKYIVIVNQKYTVKVEANSLLGAEHYILDNFEGIEGAQAFDKDGMKTEYFRDMMLLCEPISLDELQNMSDSYKLDIEAYCGWIDRKNNAQKEIEELEAKIASLKNQKEQYIRNARTAWSNAKISADKLGRRGFEEMREA